MDKYVVILLIVCFGCQDSPSTIYSVPPDAAAYVDKFFEEAAKRGIDLPQNNLIVKLTGTVEPDLCGSCNSISSREEQKTIVINQELSCWGDAYELEALFFHELGHCLLLRDHENELFPGGAPKSLMYFASISQYQSCVYQIGTEPCDLRSRRDYYVDELFDPETAAPDWADQ